MLDLTPLELAVFVSIGERWPDIRSAMERQLATARVLSRENTGAGFFTTLEIDPSAPKMAAGHPDSQDVEIEGLMHGMGFVLFTKGGRIDFLEGYTYGSPDDTSQLDFETVKFKFKSQTD